MIIRFKKRPSVWFACGFAATSLALVPAAPCAAAEFTQHRINELAAMCLETRMTLAGLKGAAKPGETSTAYRQRIHGYVLALKELEKELAPIRHTPQLKDGSGANTQVWGKIALAVNQLTGDTAAVSKAWSPKAEPAARAQLRDRLLHALRTVQAILDGLRNARP